MHSLIFIKIREKSEKNLKCLEKIGKFQKKSEVFEKNWQFFIARSSTSFQ